MNGPKQIKNNSGDKLKEAIIDKTEKKYSEAESAMSKEHETYLIGKWSKCRHCPSTCLAKNAAGHWSKKPCFRAVLKKQEPIIEGRHKIQAE